MNQLNTQKLISFLKEKTSKNKLFSMPRFRRTPAQRLLKETRLNKTDIVTCFNLAFEKVKKKAFFDNEYYYSENIFFNKVKELYVDGFQSIYLTLTSQSLNNSIKILSDCIRLLKKEIPTLNIFADIEFVKNSLCEDEILLSFGEVALILAEAGIDFITSGDAFDGRVKYLRNILDKNHFQDVGIMAKTAIFKSSFTEKTNNNYLDIRLANKKQALLKAKLDEKERSDIILISPSLFSLDIVEKIQEKSLCTIAVQQTIKECAMISSAHEKGILDEKETFYESFLAMKRAGANLIFTPATEKIKNMF